MAGTTVGGRLAVGLQQQPITIDGDLDVGAVDLPAAIAVALGIPRTERRRERRDRRSRERKRARAVAVGAVRARIAAL